MRHDFNNDRNTIQCNEHHEDKILHRFPKSVFIIGTAMPFESNKAHQRSTSRGLVVVLVLFLSAAQHFGDQYLADSPKN
jgi:hypothetical protein